MAPSPFRLILRERVVDAVVRGGLSCRKAAARFGVGESTAIAWVARFREDPGSVAPGQMGGHRPKKLIGPWREWLLERCRTADFTLRGLVVESAERGMPVDYRTVWEFVHAEGLTHKKDADRGRARAPGRRAPAGAVGEAPGPDRPVPPGVPRRDLDQDQHGAAAGLGAARASA